VLNRLSTLETVTGEDLPFIAGLVAFGIVLCFLPCVILGTISPVVAKLAVRDLERAGRTVGQIYAAGSVGSIVGTFVTGFLLISWFGTRAVVWGVRGLLLLLGLLFLLGHRWQWMLLSLLLVGGGWGRDFVLTTKEFHDWVRAWLADDGLYVINMIDGPSGHFLRATIHTLRQTFRHVTAVFSVESWRLSPRSTIVIIAGDAPLDLEGFRAVAPRSAPRLVTQQELEDLLAEGSTVTLTDRYAPLDQMLLPVFLDVVSGE